MNREQTRHAEQLAFVASGAELEVGQAQDCPLPVEQLAATTGSEDYVISDLGGGLTAHVYHIQAAGQEWTLKRARAECLVQNVDGQTSFLNEVQRRADITQLKNNPATADRMAAVVDTQYASFQHGIILSPWIAGVPVENWDERQLTELFAAMSELLLAGLFEWDFCAGNLLDDGHIRLFDFGYMYRFDPLQDFNSNGRDAPLFHGAERFETRCYFAHLLNLEQTQGQTAALSAYRLEKEIALAAYQRLLAQLKVRGVHAAVAEWLQGFITRWQHALRYDLASLYLSEGWRSHRLDLDDDLRGQTCTPLTLKRLDWLETTARENYRELKSLDAFFWHDADLSASALLAELNAARPKVEGWQITK